MREVIVEFKRRFQIDFDDSSYRWFDIKLFEFTPAESRAEIVLMSVMCDLQYRDTYIAPASCQDQVEKVHGPYDIERMPNSPYVSVGQADGSKGIAEFCSLYGNEPKPEVRRLIEGNLLPLISEADEVYRLSELPSARHDVAWVLTEFRELAAICRKSRTVALIVMGQD